MDRVPYDARRAFIFCTFWFLYIRHGAGHAEKIKAQIAEQKPLPTIQVVDYQTFTSITDLSGRYVCDRACNHFYTSEEFKEAWTKARELVISEGRNYAAKDDG